MIQQPDSLHNAHQATEPHQALEQEALEQHVLQAPDDSVAQSIYDTKSHWPVKVDTLLSPDLGKKIEAKVNPLPKYYKESFFSKDSLLHSELHAGRYGIAGDPVPYSVRNDNVLTPILIFGILLLALCIKRSSHFFSFQIRNFFHVIRTDSSLERESSSEKRYLVFAEIYTALLLAIVFFFYTKEYISETYITYSEYALMGIYFGGILGLFLFQHVLQSAVNNVFFTPSQCRHWTTTQMMLTTWGGILLTPVLLLMAYFGLSVENSLIYTLIVIIFIKILLIYKCFQIFFNKKGDFLQIFLYFCTLEVIPPLILWGILVMTANYLKVNY